MKLFNEITMAIVNEVKDGESIHSLANRIGFAYSAVYNWVNVLKDYNIIYLINKGNRNVIKINKNLIYKKFLELSDAIDVVEKDKLFWNLIKKLRLKVRFVKGTAIAIWTQGSYISGDFVDRIYFLEVYREDLDSLKKILRKNKIDYSENDINKERPLIYIISRETFRVERKNNLPVMTLDELVKWCKKLYLDNVLEQLDLMYNLNLDESYSEIRTNI